MQSTFGFSLIGQREENQDRFEVFQSDAGGELLVVVADGMGGHRDGGLAAEAAIQVARSSWQRRSATPDLKQFLTFLVADIHKSVRQLFTDKQDFSGTTLAALFLRGQTAVSVHVGDSRVIQFSDRGVVKRTFDHSVAQLRVLRGEISAHDIATHLDQNKLFNCIGSDETPIPELEDWDLDAGKRFIVCSDGYWELYSEAELARLWEKEPALAEPLQRDASQRVDRQMQHDNTTAVFIDVGDTMTDTLPNKSATTQAIAVFVAVAVLLGVAVIYLLSSPKDSTEDAKNGAPVLQADRHDAQSSAQIEDGAFDTGAIEHNPVKIDERVAPDIELKADAEAEEKGGEFGPAHKDSAAQKTERGVVVPEQIATRRDQVDIPVEGASEPISKTEDFLKKHGAMGGSDSLDSLGASRKIGDVNVVKLQQYYSGIPVWGAEATVLVAGDRITGIESKTVADIDIDIEPGLSYQQALEKAGEALQLKLEAQGEGKLVIYKQITGYTLAWHGLIIVGDDSENMIIDADSGAVLIRYLATQTDQ